MSEELTYDAKSRLMRVRVWGHDSISDMQAQRLEVIKLHEAHGSNSLLVDVRDMGSTASLFDILDFGDTWPQDVNCAILASAKTPEDILFLETVAMQRGKKMRVFFSEAEALAWLDGQ